MNTKPHTSTDAIRALNDINEIREFINKKYKEVTSDTHCDKFKRGFNVDDRFSGTGFHRISYDSSYGYYGSSSCSTFLSISNREYFWECFDTWLNKNMDHVMLGVADEMQKGLERFVDCVEKERDKLDRILSQLKGDANG